MPGSPFGGADRIGSTPVPACALCGLPGVTLYEGLVDIAFGAPGTWRLKRCANRGCGLAWMDPTPTKTDIWKAYRTYYTHQDDAAAKAIGWLDLLFIKASKPLYKVFKRITGMRRFEKNRGEEADRLFLGAPPPGAKLLDVGCGNGDILVRMRRFGWSVEGLDVDKVALERARSKHGLTVHHGSLEELRFPGDTFDAITMNHVIEHVHEPVSLLRECLRVLRHDGRIVAVTPNLESMGHRRFGRNWRGLEPPRHLHLFTGKTLGECAAAAGFRSYETFGVPGHGDGIFRSSLEIEERTSGRKRSEYSKWLETAVLNIREYRLARKYREQGEEVALVARKES